jgi:hypothetical protein
MAARTGNKWQCEKRPRAGKTRADKKGEKNKKARTTPRCVDVVIDVKIKGKDLCVRARENAERLLTHVRDEKSGAVAAKRQAPGKVMSEVRVALPRMPAKVWSLKTLALYSTISRAVGEAMSEEGEESERGQREKKGEEEKEKEEEEEEDEEEEEEDVKDDETKSVMAKDALMNRIAAKVEAWPTYDDFKDMVIEACACAVWGGGSGRDDSAEESVVAGCLWRAAVFRAMRWWKKAGERRRVKAEEGTADARASKSKSKNKNGERRLPRSSSRSCDTAVAMLARESSLASTLFSESVWMRPGDTWALKRGYARFVRITRGMECVDGLTLRAEEAVRRINHPAKEGWIGEAMARLRNPVEGYERDNPYHMFACLSYRVCGWWMGYYEWVLREAVQNDVGVLMRVADAQGCFRAYLPERSHCSLHVVCSCNTLSICGLVTDIICDRVVSPWLKNLEGSARICEDDDRPPLYDRIKAVIAAYYYGAL